MASEEELREKIAKYRRMLAQIGGDPLTAQRIQELIGDLEDELKGLTALPNSDKQ